VNHWKSFCISAMVLSTIFLPAVRMAADPSPVTISPGNLNFGKETIGMTSGAGAVGLTNHLSNSITFSMSILGDFSATNDCAGTVSPGQTCTIKVYFTPRTVAVITGSLNFLINAGGMPLSDSVTLTGTGTTSGLKSITITPANPSTPLGVPISLTAWGNYNNGTSADFTTMVAWNSTSPTVATVGIEPGTQGQVHPISQGVTTIIAGIYTFDGSTTLTVTPPVLRSISLSPLNPSVALGATQQFVASGTYTDGSTQNLTYTATWSSSSRTVASVSAGLARSLAQGVTTIIATSGSLAASTVLSVGPPALTSIAVTPSTARIVLTIGPQTQQFTATGTYTDGSTKDLTSIATWASSDTFTATVSGGLATVTGNRIGTPLVSAAVGSIQSSDHGSATLTVVTVEGVTVTPSNATIPVGGTVQLTATGTLSDHTTLDVTKNVAWYATDPSATVSQGLVTGVSVNGSGNEIKAYFFPNAVTGSAIVYVLPAVLTQISLTPSNAAVRTGTAQQFTATGTYSDGSQQDYTDLASWTSSDPAVATAAPDGVAAAIAPGTATITALVTGPGLPSTGISGSATITVSGQVASISVSPATATVPLGNTQQFTATGTYSDGTTAILSAATWSSSDTNVATVTGGLASSTGQGSAIISASVGSATGTAALTVAPPALVSISVTPAHASLLMGSSLQLAATGTYTDKSTQDLTASVNWSSLKPAVASVANHGLATASAVGVTTITAASEQVSGSTPLGVATPGQARFAYVPLRGNGTLDLFLVDNSNGSLVPAETVDYPNGSPATVAADPTGKYLYVSDMTNSLLYAYTIDQITGSLHLMPGMPIVSFSNWNLTVDPSGRLLLLSNGGGVVAYRLDATGFPTLLTSTTAVSDIHVAIDPAGKFAYTANVNDNSVSVFSLDASAGQVTEIPGSPFPVPGPNPEWVTVYPLGGYLFLPNGNGQSISVFALDPNTGALVGSATNYSVGEIPEAVALDPAGKFAYVANSASGTISAFTVDSATGALTPVDGSPFVVASGFFPGPSTVTVGPEGKRLFAIITNGNNQGSDVVVLSIDPSTGALTQTSSLTLSARPSSITLVH
jgi:6-phosphogluconolactonase (cycloisomerase 2 family)/uncharacterized protein YjdB